MFKKLLSFLLAAAILFSLTVTAAASDNGESANLSIKLVDDNNNEIDTYCEDGTWLGIYASDYDDYVGDTESDWAIASMMVLLDADTKAFTLSGNWDSPYDLDNDSLMAVASDGEMRVLYETDSVGYYQNTISKSELDANGGLIAKVEITNAKKSATCSFALKEQKGELKTSVGLITSFGDVSLLPINCDNESKQISMLQPVTGLKATSVSYNSVKLNWTKQAGVTGYVIYRSTNKSGDYEQIDSVYKASTVSYTDTGLTAGKTYYYKVCAYKTSTDAVGDFSSVVSVKPVPNKVTGLKATSVSYNSVKLNWTKQAGVTGYVIYRSTSKSGTYKKIDSVYKSSTVSYTDTGLTAGKTYYYKVRAYKSKTTIVGSFSSAVSAKSVPKKVNITSVSNTSSKKITVKVEKQAGVTGYVFYRSTSKSGEYKAVYTVVGASKTSYTDKGLTKGKTYYYKVRAYKTVSGKKIYGAYSSIKYAKVSK